VSEIAAASNEQSQGIGQVSTSIRQMDQVTQANAAGAEESAAASEELSAQAENLRGGVRDLIELVGGVVTGPAAVRSEKVGVGRTAAAKPHPTRATVKALTKHKPEHVIPLDDETVPASKAGDFSEFDGRPACRPDRTTDVRVRR
jgi:methyl-accepting chemotaxis protein